MGICKSVNALLEEVGGRDEIYLHQLIFAVSLLKEELIKKVI